MSKVTISTEIPVESVLSNYSDAFDEYDDKYEECRACYSTGMDRDEIYECEDCGGEGVIYLYRQNVRFEDLFLSP